jgi:hypothetical protein
MVAERAGLGAGGWWLVSGFWFLVSGFWFLVSGLQSVPVARSMTGLALREAVDVAVRWKSEQVSEARGIRSSGREKQECRRNRHF